jgi:hypothetical protein
MKILSEPSSGKRGIIVAFISRFGQCQRALVSPKNTWSPARDHMRGAFGRLARAWSGLLTEAQRVAWCEAGPKVQSAGRLGTSGPLTGQQHFQGINSARARIGLDMLLLPPDPVVFSPNPVGDLLITNDDNGVRLFVNLSAPITEDIMVFGQAPCSSGRRKRRNLSYLGLLAAAQAGLSEITALYVARFGVPAVGQRVFIVTRQQKDGWEGFDQQTTEIVPPKPADQQAPATGALPLPVPMLKGCTRDAQGTAAPPPQDTVPIGSLSAPMQSGAPSPLQWREGQGNGEQSARLPRLNQASSSLGHGYLGQSFALPRWMLPAASAGPATMGDSGLSRSTSKLAWLSLASITRSRMRSDLPRQKSTRVGRLDLSSRTTQRSPSNRAPLSGSVTDAEPPALFSTSLAMIKSRLPSANCVSIAT